jgi:hypothetical protein
MAAAGAFSAARSRDDGEAADLVTVDGPETWFDKLPLDCLLLAAEGWRAPGSVVEGEVAAAGWPDLDGLSTPCWGAAVHDVFTGIPNTTFPIGGSWNCFEA